MLGSRLPSVRIGVKEKGMGYVGNCKIVEIMRGVKKERQKKETCKERRKKGRKKEREKVDSLERKKERKKERKTKISV